MKINTIIELIIGPPVVGEESWTKNFAIWLGMLRVAFAAFIIIVSLKATMSIFSPEYAISWGFRPAELSTLGMFEIISAVGFSSLRTKLCGAAGLLIAFVIAMFTYLRHSILPWHILGYAIVVVGLTWGTLWVERKRIKLDTL